MPNTLTVFFRRPASSKASATPTAKPPMKTNAIPWFSGGYFSSHGPEASDNRRARHGPVQGPRTEAHRYLLPSRLFHPPFFIGLGSPKILSAQSDIQGHPNYPL